MILFVLIYNTSFSVGYANNKKELDSLLVEYYNLSISSKDSNTYKVIFFKIFPDTFHLFDSIYSWHEIDDSLYLHPLYNVAMEHIQLFFSLKDLVNKDVFIRKVIKISLCGENKVDAINIFQYNLQMLFLDNTIEFLEELQKFSDIEVKSFWHFFFDNNIFDHPYCVEKYKEVHKKIKLLGNKRMLNLMEEQYKDDNNYRTGKNIQYNGNSRIKDYGKKFHEEKSICYLMEIENLKNSFNYHWETFFSREYIIKDTSFYNDLVSFIFKDTLCISEKKNHSFFLIYDTSYSYIDIQTRMLIPSSLNVFLVPNTNFGDISKGFIKINNMICFLTNSMPNHVIDNYFIPTKKKNKFKLWINELPFTESIPEWNMNIKNGKLIIERFHCYD